MIAVMLIQHLNFIQVRATLRCHAHIGVFLFVLPDPQPRLP